MSNQQYYYNRQGVGEFPQFCSTKMATRSVHVLIQPFNEPTLILTKMIQDEFQIDTFQYLDHRPEVTGDDKIETILYLMIQSPCVKDLPRTTDAWFIESPDGRDEDDEVDMDDDMP